MLRRLLALLPVLFSLLLPSMLLAQEAAPFGEGEEPPVALIVGAVLVVLVIGIFVFLVIQGIISYLVYLNIQRIPATHREIEPWKAFLLMIPCFNLVWNFFVYPALSRSYQSYFNSIGRTDVGDCGSQLALWYCIVAACAVVPYVGALSGFAALVLLIIYLVKAFQLRGMIPDSSVVAYGKPM